MKFIPFTRTQDGVAFNLKGRPRNVSSDNPAFKKILQAIIDVDVTALESLCDIPGFVALVTKGDVKISEDEVRFRDQKVPDYLATRIIAYMNDGLPIDPICKFAEKLMGNVTEDVREDMYRWLEKGNMPIYSDGDFLAYKVVRSDFNSIHSGPEGPVFQGVGEVVTLDREKCDANRDVTCSSGLHFCSYDYLPHFGGMNNDRNRVIIVKINPADVVAIPTDYNLTKGRCCRFEVMETVPVDEIQSRYQNGNVIVNVKVDEVEIEFDVEVDSWAEEDSWGEAVDVSPNEVTSAAIEEGEEILQSKGTPPVFTRDGKTYSYGSIVDIVTREGPVRASEILGVPRSTLGGWYRKAQS